MGACSNAVIGADSRVQKANVHCTGGMLAAATQECMDTSEAPRGPAVRYRP